MGMGMGMGGKVAVSCVVGPAVMNLLRQGIGPGLRQCVSIRSSSSSSSSISSSASSPFYYYHHNNNTHHHPLSLSLSMNNNNSRSSRRRRLMSFRAHSSFSHHDVNDSGSIDSPLISSMHSKIKEQLKAESVTVKDAYGDGRHVSIDVISSVFEGESAVSRQRMVYKAIWEELQNTVHAVDQMTTKTPSEAAATNK